MTTLIKWMKNTYGQTDRKIFILITFLNMCEHVERHVSVVGMVVRAQLAGVSSHYHCVGLRDWSQVSRLGGRHLC